MPDYLPLHDPGRSITRTASAPITGGQLVIVTGPGLVGPSTAPTHAWLGVAANDTITGDQVTVYRMGVARLTAASAVTAGQHVHPAANGQIEPHTNGTSDVWDLGLALTTAAAGGIVEVKLRR